MVASKGEYGEKATQTIQELIRNHTHDEICFATIEILPRDPVQETNDTVVRRLDFYDKARAVIVFLNEDKISELLDACERCGIPQNRFIWIGSDGWGAKERIVANREQIAEGTITILPKRYPIE
ncbi:metabotropic glutamate receptor 8, partial [Nephila pilipes]